MSDYYSPRGLFTPAEGGDLVIAKGAGCRQRTANARGECFGFEEPSDAQYGFVFAYPGFDFGRKPGMTLPVGITKLHFVAAVDEASQRKNISLQVGWSTPTSETPYAEDVVSQPHAFELTSAWQPFEIPLLVSAPMVGNALGTQALGPITFYLDDLWFE